MSKKETIHTRIWREDPAPDNPFAAETCYCHGYDVYGDMLGKAGWIEYLYLLFQGERPSPPQKQLLENLCVALANPGIRDHSVRAAMNGGVGGSHAAASLMAALAVGAGQLGGAHEVFVAMQWWEACGTNLSQWKEQLANPPQEERMDVWQPMEHPPGFDPYGESCTGPVRRTLDILAGDSPGPALPWLKTHRPELEEKSQMPLAMTGVTAAALHDLGLTAEKGEMLYLIVRLPGAGIHALEQKEFGYRRYPFFQDAVHLEDDPGPHPENPKAGQGS